MARALLFLFLFFGVATVYVVAVVVVVVVGGDMGRMTLLGRHMAAKQCY